MLDTIASFRKLGYLPLKSSRCFMEYCTTNDKARLQVNLNMMIGVGKKHPSSPSVFSGVRVARSLVFYVVFCRSLFVLCSFSFIFKPFLQAKTIVIISDI